VEIQNLCDTHRGGLKRSALRFYNLIDFNRAKARKEGIMIYKKPEVLAKKISKSRVIVALSFKDYDYWMCYPPW